MSEPSEMKPNLADKTCELLKWVTVQLQKATQ